MATDLRRLGVASRLPVIAAGAIAAGGTAVTIATLVLTTLDHESAPAYTLAGLDVGWSLALRTIVGTLTGITTSLVAGIIVWRQRSVLFSLVVSLTVALGALSGFADAYAVRGLLAAPGSLPLPEVAAWFEWLAGIAVNVGIGLILLLFPDGRLKSSRWLPAVGLVVLAVAAPAVVRMYDPYPLQLGSGQWVPVSLPPALWQVGAEFGWASAGVSWAAPALAVLLGVYIILRLVQASGETRLQITWFTYAATIGILTGVLRTADNPPAVDWLPDSARLAVQGFVSSETAHAVASWSGLGNGLATGVLLPIAVGIAIVRYRLYQIEVVVNRTILYAGLAVFVTAGYGIVVAGAGSLLGMRAGLGPLLTILAIALVAALLEPVRARLQALANMAVYGRRARPYEVLSDLARSVGRAESTEVLLPRMADLLRQGTGASSAEVWVRIGERLGLAASSPPASEGARTSVADPEELAGRLGPRATVVPVFEERELLGALAITMPQGESLNAIERQLVEDVGSHAGLVFSRFRLVEELRESRARLVAAQDLERRRIERNLHDGAQQRFANALLALGMAQAQPGRRTPGQDLVAQASEEVRAGLADLRELARGVHPPLLSESGLVAAIRSLADRSPILASVRAGPERRFPVVVETAAYYVVAEALANAAKHSQARSVEVTIKEEAGRLRVAVADDGIGGAVPAGDSGLVGLRDRVAAVGGTIVVNSPTGKGTVLSAELPCE